MRKLAYSTFFHAMMVPSIVCLPHTSGCAAEFEVERDDAFVSVSLDGRPLLEYRYGDAAPKPYIKELYSPRGVQILRDSPHDHVHHRGLMYGIFANGVDFWSEQANHGKQIDVRLTTTSATGQRGLSTCRLDESLRWTLQEGTTLLTEQRSVAVFASGDLGATLLSWHTHFEPADGIDQVRLTGNHYDGLGVRFVESMDGVGRFFYASGEPGPIVRGTERVTRCRWIAYAAPVDGDQVTVALFDHPDNRRHPAGMFTMLKQFAYMSVTPNIWKSPLDLRSGEALDYDYGVALWDGEVKPEGIERIYKRWLELAGQLER